MVHIPHMLQGEGLVSRKVPIIVDVTHSTIRCWHSPQIVLSVIAFRKYLEKVNYPYPKHLFFDPPEPVTISQHGALSMAEVSIYQRNKVVPYSHSLPTSSCRKILRSVYWGRISHLFPVTFAFQQSTVYRQKSVCLHCIEPLSSLWNH